MNRKRYVIESTNVDNPVKAESLNLETAGRIAWALSMEFPSITWELNELFTTEEAIKVKNGKVIMR